MQHFPQVHNATKAQAQEFLSEDEVMARFAIPEGVHAAPVGISARAKVDVTTEGEVQVRFNSDRNQTYILADKDANASLMSFIGIPAEVAKSYPSKLVTPLLTHGLSRKDGAVVVIDEDGKLLSIQDQAKLKPVMSAEQVLTNIRQQWPEVQFQDASIMGSKGNNAYGSDLLAITHNEERRLETMLQPGLHQFLPDGGDPFRAGVHVHFNPMGVTAPAIEPYLLRLVCRNGAIHAEYISDEWGKGYGEGDELWQWFRDGLVASDTVIGTVMDKYSAMIGESFDGQDRVRALEGYIGHARLGREDALELRNRAIENPIRNAYDLFNLATAQATHGAGKRTLNDLVGRQRRAAFTGGAAHAHNACPTCHRN